MALYPILRDRPQNMSLFGPKYVSLDDRQKYEFPWAIAHRFFLNLKPFGRSPKKAHILGDRPTNSDF